MTAAWSKRILPGELFEQRPEYGERSEVNPFMDLWFTAHC